MPGKRLKSPSNHAEQTILMQHTKRTLSPTTAFIAVAIAFMINMMGTTLPTPIYHFYQQRYSLTPTMITIIYACYAVGVLGALLTVGNWSDQLGRRRMLLAGLFISGTSAIAFMFSVSPVELMAARLLSGVSAGIFTGTATVAVIELSPPAWQRQATLAATASNMLGLGLGPLLSGILVTELPRPMFAPYAFHLALVGAALCGVWRAPETSRNVTRATLRFQRLSLPHEVRSTFVPAALAGFAGFVVVGFFAAVAPQLMSVVLGYHDSIVIGTLVFLLFACSALAQLFQNAIGAPYRMSIGCVCLAAGLACIALCVFERSLAALVVGTILSGMGQGISFRASLSDLAMKSPADRRAEVTSSFFVVLYIAISLPVIGLGVAVQHFGVARATSIFAAVTIATVLVALWLISSRGTERSESATTR